jgi:hypothetical protein
MPRIPIREIAFDPGAGVRIAPELPPHEDYDAVYRGAMSVRWEDGAFTLYMVPRPDRTPAEAFRRIIAEVEREYGDQLVLGPNTAWRDLSAADQAAIRAASAHQPR